jgi:hypothetical protein
MESTEGTTDTAAERAQDALDASDRAAERSSAAARKMKESRETMQRLAGEIADTEDNLARTLRHAAAAATHQGRDADAERLIKEAEQAERYAEVERRRADGD